MEKGRIADHRRDPFHALARDAKVAEIVGDFPYGATSSQMVALAEEVLDVHRWTAP